MPSRDAGPCLCVRADGRLLPSLPRLAPCLSALSTDHDATWRVDSCYH